MTAFDDLIPKKEDDENAFGDLIPQKNQADPFADAAQQGVLGINRGMNSIVALPGELASWAVNAAGFPETAEALRWNNQASRAITRPDIQPETALGKVANATGQAVGATVAPTGAIIGNASRLAAMAPKTALQGVGQQMGQQVVNAGVGRAVAAETAAASSGGAVSELAAQGTEALGGGETAQNVSRVVGGLAGAIAPSAVAAGARKVTVPLKKARANQGEKGAYVRLAENAVEGDPTAANAKQAITNLEKRFSAGGKSTDARSGEIRLATQRILGEEMERAGGNAAVAKAATIKRLEVQHGVAPETAQQQFRNLEGLHKENPLMFGEQSAVASSDDALRGQAGGLKRSENVDVDALKSVQDTPMRGDFDYLASSGNSRSAIDTRNALLNRQDKLSGLFQGLTKRMQETGNSNGQARTIEQVDEMIVNAKKAAKLEYENAYQGSINQRPIQQTLPKILERFNKQAEGRAGDIRESMEWAMRQLHVDSANGPQPVSSLRQLQDARTVLREEISDLYKAGKARRAIPLEKLYKDVTAVMKKSSPKWAEANAKWADMAFDVMGRELGDAFIQKPGPKFRQQLADFKRMAPEAQDVVRTHFVQKMLDSIEGQRDSNSIAKHFQKPHVRNAIRELFGDKAAVDLTRSIRDIGAAESTFSQNSRTHIRGEVKEGAEQYQRLSAGEHLMSKQGIKDAVLDWTFRALLEARNRPLAKAITTPMNNAPAVALQLRKLREGAKTVDDLNIPTPPAPRGPGRFVPGAQGAFARDDDEY